ncbi:MAG: hypothetical protein EBU49_07030 [Proteobacteria bacterium]|nr:hypothetical protein [Pseudomonadota bacterium]
MLFSHNIEIGAKIRRGAFILMARWLMALTIAASGVAACGKSQLTGSSNVRKSKDEPAMALPAIPATPAPSVVPTSLPSPLPPPVAPSPPLPQQPGDEIQSLEVTPALQSVAINNAASFAAFATYSISGRRNVTAQAAWTANAPAIGLSQGSGSFKGIATGTTGIVARMGGKTASAALQVFPGVSAQKVGVNFEDHPFTGDKDFNDAVLCFTGKVAVSSGSVVSLEDQTIAGVVSHRSLCDADMTISIAGPGAYTWTRTFVASQQPTYQMPFKAGSRLEVIFNPASRCGDNARAEVRMNNPDWARILPNVCNTQGN